MWSSPTLPFAPPRTTTTTTSRPGLSPPKQSSGPAGHFEHNTGAACEGLCFLSLPPVQTITCCQCGVLERSAADLGQNNHLQGGKKMVEIYQTPSRDKRGPWRPCRDRLAVLQTGDGDIGSGATTKAWRTSTRLSNGPSAWRLRRETHLPANI